MSRILVAKTNALIEYDGRRIVIKGGITTAREGHDVVKAHPELWTPQKVNFEVESKTVEPVTPTPVESATAAPGERRTVATPSAAPTRRGRRTTTKGDDDK